jgi:UDP-N-acetyl-D-mannosaminuronate dehydrogenase
MENPVLEVIGAGYVGLPMCVAAAQAGLRVIAVDNNPAVVEGIRGGRLHIQVPLLLLTPHLAAVLLMVLQTADLYRSVSVCVIAWMR